MLLNLASFALLLQVSASSPVAKCGSNDPFCTASQNDWSPSYVQAMRRCMSDDDIECFRMVQKFFQELTPSRVNQLPALAAHMGAKKIFFNLGFNETDARWSGWMDRVKVHSYLSFNDKNFSQTLDNGNSMPFYSAVKYFVDQSRFNQSLTIVDCLVTKPKPSPKGSPSLNELLAVLITKDNAVKAQKVDMIKAALNKLLSSGTYILDDTLDEASITWLLWYYYGSDKEKDPISAEFLEWLIQEGAPIDERGLFLNHEYSVHVLDKKTNPMSAQYLNMFKMAVKYSSGTATKSLTRLLRTMGLGYFDHMLQRIPSAIAVYEYVFPGEIVFLDPSMLRALVYLFSKRRITFENGVEVPVLHLSEGTRELIVRVFFHRGLSEDVLGKMRVEIEAWPQSSSKTRFLEGIDLVMQEITRMTDALYWEKYGKHRT